MSGIGRRHAMSIVASGFRFRRTCICRIDFDKLIGEGLGSLGSTWMASIQRGGLPVLWTESKSATTLPCKESESLSQTWSGEETLAKRCIPEHSEMDLCHEWWRNLFVPVLTHPTAKNYAFLLRRCGNAKFISEGKHIHAHILENGRDKDRFLGNLLIQMYGKCGAPWDAHAVFNRIHKRNVFSWAMMIGAYIHHRHSNEALQLYKQLQQEGVVPDEVTFISVLSACAMEASLYEGHQVHASIINHGFESDLIVATALVNMYNKCGGLSDAVWVFDSIPEKNVVSWNAVIAAYAQHENGMEAIQLFHQMQFQNIHPDKVTFITVLSACASQETMAEGRSIHAQIVDNAFESDVEVVNALIHMYGKCSNLTDAWWMFDKMCIRNAVSWNAIIGAHSQSTQGQDAFFLFQQMQQEGVIPDTVTFLTTLFACGNQASLTKGKQIHAVLMGLEVELDALGNVLLCMYGKCGNTDNARKMFEIIAVRDVVSWNAMIGVYSQSGQAKEAFQLFGQMLLEGILPDKVTFLAILSACTGLETLVEGKQVHTWIVSAVFESNADTVVGNALINMYGNCCSLKEALLILSDMNERSTGSWNAIIAAYSQHGKVKEIQQVFQQMMLEGSLPDKTTFSSILDACAGLLGLVDCKQKHAFIVGSGFELDVVVGTSLITAYAKYGNIENAQEVFDNLLQHNTVCLNAMVAAYVQNKQGQAALQLFQQFKLEGLVPDKVTFVSILSACATQADLVEGKLIHSCIVDGGLEKDVIVGTALVNMYGKCGSLDDARETFNKMPEQNGISWNSMITSYAQHEKGSKALQRFQQMQLECMIPDRSTFVSVLSTCANQSLLAEGKRKHASIWLKGFEWDVVGNALVNMYAKCGSLEDAHNIFNNLPERNSASWNAMIGSYSQHGQCREAMQLFCQMLNSGAVPDMFTFSSILSACSHAGLIDEGCYGFVSMSQEHGITPRPEHLNCMIDLFGRVGRLHDGERFINGMPFQPTGALWMALLSACRSHFDIKRARRVAEHVFEVCPKFAAPYVLLSNTWGQ